MKFSAKYICAEKKESKVICGPKFYFMHKWVCVLELNSVETFEFSKGDGLRVWKFVYGYGEHRGKRYRSGQPAPFEANPTVWYMENTAPAPPTLLELLGGLNSDFRGYNVYSRFETWADEFGYNSDSREAERTYNTIADNLRKFVRLTDERTAVEFKKLDEEAIEAWAIEQGWIKPPVKTS